LRIDWVNLDGYRNPGIKAAEDDYARAQQAPRLREASDVKPEVQAAIAAESRRRRSSTTSSWRRRRRRPAQFLLKCSV